MQHAVRIDQQRARASCASRTISTARPGRTTPPAITSSGTRRIGPSASAAATRAPKPCAAVGKRRYRPDDAVGAPQARQRHRGTRQDRRGGQILTRIRVLQHEAQHRRHADSAWPAPRRRPRENRSGPASSMSSAERRRMAGRHGSHHLGQPSARPGPWTEPGQRSAVDIDDDHAGIAGGRAAAAAAAAIECPLAQRITNMPRRQAPGPQQHDEAHQPRKPGTQTAPQRRQRQRLPRHEPGHHSAPDR